LNKIEFIEYNLDNGLKIVLQRDRRLPLINLTLGYKVGSKDEQAGKKGIAHLFEHLMFQGSANIKKNEHFSIIQNTGGECNAYTNQDITVYYEKIPSNFLETALWLESDRMISLNLTEENLDNQKKVVIEEKHSRYDNAPYGTSFINILKHTLINSNYESATIGNEKDILAFTVEDAIGFHKKFYSPSNAVLILSGDFEYRQAKFQILKYFGSIKKPGVTERIPNIVNSLDNSDRLTFYDNVKLPVLYICYRIPKIGNQEDYTLEYFTNLMANNKSSILYKRLVYEKKLLNSLQVFKYQIEQAGILIFVAMLNEGTNLDNVENEIYTAIGEFYNDGFIDTDYEKIKNEIVYHITLNYSVLMNINLELLHNLFFHNDLNRINTKIDNYLAVKKEDVLKSVHDYLINKPKIVIQYLPFKK
jgi:predicted Zn-dependent peptidase